MSKLVEVRSEISGSVWKIEVNEGSIVAEGEELVILESMKMEIPCISPESGTVKELKVKEGDSINQDDVILVLEID